MLISSFLVLLTHVTTPVLAGRCYDPWPAFPSGLKFDVVTFHGLQKKLESLLKNPHYDIASASIELTSSTETLWSFYHTAREQNKTRPGASVVDGNSQYRIASITKAYTVLALLKQHKAGNLDINDPVSEYIPELAGDDSGELPWKDITLRAMASQLSGLPREFGQGDILDELSEPWTIGLPPEPYDTLPPCFRPGSGIVCSKAEIIDYVKTYKPLFAPNQQSTYSNLNFELLGMVIEHVTGQSYDSYIKDAILDPLEMHFTSLEKPSDKHAVLPKGGNSWDVDIGALSPTGGIYSSATDQSKFLRYVLTHYNALVTGINWLHPASFSGSLETSYGMPWEIFRTADILEESKRPVTFITKGGGLPAYSSMIAMLPEYGLGITLLVGGPHDVLTELIEIATIDIVRAAETVIWKHMNKKYSGVYVSTKPELNSSIAFSVSSATGLAVDNFISNGTDVLKSLPSSLPQFGNSPRRPQLTPTLLYKHESSRRGEIFRLQFPDVRTTKQQGVWDSFCVTDVDSFGSYAGLPSNEIVFWHERQEVELPAWKVTLKRLNTARQHSHGDQVSLQVEMDEDMMHY